MCVQTVFTCTDMTRPCLWTALHASLLVTFFFGATHTYNVMPSSLQDHRVLTLLGVYVPLLSVHCLWMQRLMLNNIAGKIFAYAETAEAICASCAPHPIVCGLLLHQKQHQ